MLIALALILADPVLSDHYRLEHEGNAAEAAEYSRVLEAAWPEFKRIFGAEPKLRKGERLTVRSFATFNAWAAAIRLDRGIPPADAGGYYWPLSKTAYIYRQPAIIPPGVRRWPNTR